MAEPLYITSLLERSEVGPPESRQRSLSVAIFCSYILQLWSHYTYNNGLMQPLGRAFGKGYRVCLMVQLVLRSAAEHNLTTSATHSRAAWSRESRDFPAFWCFRLAVFAGQACRIPDQSMEGHSQNLMDLYSAQLRHDVAYTLLPARGSALRFSRHSYERHRSCTNCPSEKRKGCRGAATLMNQLLEKWLRGSDLNKRPWVMRSTEMRPVILCDLVGIMKRDSFKIFPTARKSFRGNFHLWSPPTPKQEARAGR